MMTIPILLAAVTHWAVPPMSDVMRLPDTEPTDGVKGGAVRIVAAKGEYEPGSFVVRSDIDLGKVTLEVSDLRQVDGAANSTVHLHLPPTPVFPKENLDLKVVKVWYQNLNGWYSYFGDKGDCKLVPELLVNDEDLIRVDTAKKANYARLTAPDGKVTERWINPPAEMDKRPSNVSFRGFDTFFPMRPDFADAKTLQPVTLKKGEAKQFFLTAHVRKGTLPGVYRGEIKVKVKGEGVGVGERCRCTKDGSNSTVRLGPSPSPSTSTLLSIPVELTVLDFELPQPKSYVNPEMDFWVSFYTYVSIDYCTIWNGGDRELAKRQFASIMADQAAHGQNMKMLLDGYKSGTWYPGVSPGKGEEDFLFTYNLMRDLGMITKPLMVAGGTATPALNAYLDRTIGHHDIYIPYGDEPGVKSYVSRHRRIQKAGQEYGFKYFLACAPHAFAKGAHVLDWHNTNSAPEDDTLPRRWNALGCGKRIAWYAAQHVGVEDPAFQRRQNGLACWLSGYNTLCNYAHHLGPYNDAGGTYKPMCFFYGVHGGVLDTIAWEGFREGIDDIRYATLACELARAAEKSTSLATRRLGMKTLAWFVQFDRTRADLNAARLEMARQIVDLRKALGVKDGAVASGRSEDTRGPRAAVASGLVQAAPQKAAADDLSGIMFGRYAETEAAADAAVAAAKKAGKPLAFATSNKGFRLGNRAITPLRAARDIKWVLGKYDELKALCDGTVASNTNLPPADVFELKLSAAVAPLKGTPAEIEAAVAKIEPALAKGVDPKDRLGVIRNCGAVALAANHESLVRGLAAYLERVAPTQPKRLYTVKYTSHPVSGPDSWLHLGFEPERQEMSRNYGGAREFFLTDVATGDRGAAGAGELKSRPQMSVVCDDWGVHFRFVDPDAKAKEIELGLVPGGSYEAYLAPGAGTPYFCFLLYPEDRQMGVMNTLYDHPGFRRIDPTSPTCARNRTVFTKDTIETYASFAWETWADRIPTDGFRWDFEIVRWGRAGSAAWNGLKNVHGRSSWGELAFALPPAARAAILRRLVVRAKNAYQEEKVATRTRTGVFDYWQDEDIGDPAFYESRLAPLEKELDGFAARVTAEMTDETVLELAKTALPKWRDAVYAVAARRTEYLTEKLQAAATAAARGEPRISVFASFIRGIAEQRGISKKEAGKLLMDLGVRGFDCGPDETDIAELMSSGLKPINFYYFPDWFKRDLHDWSIEYSDRTDMWHCLNLAVKYGIPRIMVVPPNFTDGKENEKEFQAIVKEMARFVRLAKGRGITVTIEDFGGTKNCCSYAKYLKRMLTEIPDLKFALDTGNLYYAGRGEDILEMMAFAKGRIGHVHLKDQTKENNRAYATLGLGAVPNEKVVKAVRDTGYDGWYTLENPVGDIYADTLRQTAILKEWLK